MKKIFLSVSEVSSYIGLKKYNKVDSFESLWKKVDNNYKSILSSLDNTQPQTQEIRDNLVMSKVEKLENTIGKETLNLINSSNIQTDQKKDILDNKINKIKSDMLIIEKLETTLGKETLDIINSSDIQIDQKKEILDNKINTMNISTELLDEIKNLSLEVINNPNEFKTKLTEEKINNIKLMGIDVINTTHGINEEPKTINIIQNDYEQILDNSQAYKFHHFLTLTNDWYIGGRMDIIDHKNKIVIEVKNRMNKLFNRVVDYEMCQIQLYMWLIDYRDARLTEKYINRSHQEYMKTHTIEYDPIYVDSILNRLRIFIVNFEDNFINNIETKLSYIQLNKDDKLAFIDSLIGL